MEEGKSGRAVFNDSLFQFVTDKLDAAVPDLNFENADKTLRHAFEIFDTEEGQLFISTNLSRMIAILTNQNPTIVGAQYLKFIDGAMIWAVKIILVTFNEEPLKWLSVIMMMLNPGATYFTGVKSYYSSYATGGMPGARLGVIAAFAEGNGFASLSQYIANKRPDEYWFGFTNYEYAILSVMEKSVEDAIKADFVNVVLANINQLTEKDLKIESTVKLESFFCALLAFSSSKVIAAELQHTVTDFFLEFTLKLLSCESIVMKLVGWEQVQSLVEEALTSRPLSKSITVTNAGTWFVNGQYEFKSFSMNGFSARYEKQACESSPEIKMLTLHTSMMKGGNKNKWYISHIYSDQIGLEHLDTDYYCSASHVSALSEPPACGWVTAETNTTALEPCPRLQRTGDFLIADGKTVSDYLIVKMEKWVVENDLINHVFRVPIHREVMSRSGKLILFLTEIGIITTEHMSLLWESAMSSHETDVVDEIFVTISRVTALTRDENLLSHFFDLVLQLITVSRSENNNSVLLFTKVCCFLEKYAVMDAELLCALSLTSLHWILRLIWETLKNPLFESVAPKMCTSIESLFSTVLVALTNYLDAASPNELVLQYVQECGRIVLAKGGELEISLNGVFGKDGTVKDEQNFKIVSKYDREIGSVLKILNFLLSRHFNEVIADVLSKEDFHAILIDDLKRYVSHHRQYFLSGLLKESVYQEEIASRLTLLAQIYLPSSTVPLPKESLLVMWAFLSLPCEQAEMFRFLGKLGMSLLGNSTTRTEAAITGYRVDFLEESSFIFSRMVCSELVDWKSVAGVEPYECFETYFLPLCLSLSSNTSLTAVAVATSSFSTLSVQPSTSDTAAVDQSENKINEILSQGLNTLWQIVLNVSSDSAAKQAISLLLSIYKGKKISEANVTLNELLDKVFAQFNKVLISHVEGVDGVAVSAVERMQITRSIQVLNAALFETSFSYTVNSRLNLPHLANGTIGGIKVKLCYKKVYGNVNFMSVNSYDATRAVKGSEGIVIAHVHPLQSLVVLKQKVAAALKCASLSKIVLRYRGEDIEGDSATLLSLGIVEDCTVEATCSTYQHGSFNKTAAMCYNSVDGISSDDDEEQFADGSVHPMGGIGSIKMSLPDMLWRDSHKYECLMTLLDLLHDDRELADHVWSFVMRMPTHQTTKRNITTSLKMFSHEQYASAGGYDEDDDDNASSPSVESEKEKEALVHLVDWTKLLGPTSSLHRVVYSLQIMDSILVPSEGNRNLSASLRSKQFQTHFIESGGYFYLVDLFVSLPIPKKCTDQRMGYSLFYRNFNTVALHILHHLLFNETSVTDGDGVGDNVNDGEDVDDMLDVLLPCIQHHSNAMLERLLSVASDAAEMEDSSVVNKALVMITNMLDFPNVISQLTSNPHSKTLISVVLRSGSKKVRKLAADFAIKVGKTQHVVFSWLVSDIESFNRDDINCDDTFSSLNGLLLLRNAADDGEEFSVTSCSEKGDRIRLAQLLSDRLCGYISTQQNQTKSMLDEDDDATDDNFYNRDCILSGYLQLLESLIIVDNETFEKTSFSKDVFASFLSHFLFPTPNHETKQRSNAICMLPNSRKAAFMVMNAYLYIDKETSRESIFQWLNGISRPMLSQMKRHWKVQISLDSKPSGIKYTGLKNQGCTCYMNSLLQQLFMNVSFREAILNAPLLECHRSTLWNRRDGELVGLSLLFENMDGSWKVGSVLEWLPEDRFHQVAFLDSTGDHVLEFATYRIAYGRPLKETGRYKIVDTEESQLPEMTDCVASAHLILEQLQRTFMFMKYSKRRYYDPKPFVDACKSLNLSYNIYQQNDASEFCDKLLDRLETGMGAKFSGIDSWNDVVQKTIFGGKLASQKIPKQCESFSRVREQCEQWNGSREESFFNIELIIRGKESIDESLNEMIQGELMDGENKLTCDKCGEKKAVTRRMCIGTLPNTMILHLKRFDLDFSTFETVKLNNKIAFNRTLNMLKYCKEGLAASDEATMLAQEPSPMATGNGGSGNGGTTTEGSVNVLHSPGRSGLRKSLSNAEDEKDKTQDAADEVLSISVNFPDEADFEYGLQGVLVHSGFAQGGHYFSFIKEDLVHKDKEDGNTMAGGDSSEKWFKFDDDDVSAFNPEYISYQCFGGSRVNTVGNRSTEDEIESNALMLFYMKKSKSPAECNAKTAEFALRKEETETSMVAGRRLVNGYAAFSNEIWESNSHHVVLSYLLDLDLQCFIHRILNSLGESVDTFDDDMLPSFQNCCRFLFDIALHCKDRAVSDWVAPMREVFSRRLDAAVWFIQESLRHDEMDHCWLYDYLVVCSDPLAREVYMEVLGCAIGRVSNQTHSDSEVKLFFEMGDIPDLATLAGSCNTALLVCTVLKVLRLVTDVAGSSYVKHAEELFTLLRNISKYAIVRRLLLEHTNMLLILSFYVLPEKSIHQSIHCLFSHMTIKVSSRHLFKMFTQTVYEAICNLLGIPQVRKVSLLQESTHVANWDQSLTPIAVEAFQTIFEEASNNSGGMSMSDISAYFARIHASRPVKLTPYQLKNVLDCNDKNPDGRLNFQGFLTYYRNACQMNVANVWKDLLECGFRNDLSRVPDIEEASAFDECDLDHLSSNEFFCNAKQCVFQDIHFYEAGFEAAENCVTAVIKKMCKNDLDISALLIRQGLVRLYTVISARDACRQSEGVLLFLNTLVRIQDTDSFTAARLDALLVGDEEYSLMSVVEQERMAPSKCRCNEYYPSSMQKQYMEFIRQMHASIPAFSNYLTDRVRDESADEQWYDAFIRIRDQLVAPVVSNAAGSLATSTTGPISSPALATLNNVKTGLSRDEMNLMKYSAMSIVVSNAGVSEVNGTYEFHSVRSSQSVSFSKRVKFGDAVENMVIYRCKMESGAYCWFISIVPPNVDAGTKDDIDYYSISSVDSKIFPPFSSAPWDICSEVPVGGVYPLPCGPVPSLKLINANADTSPELVADKAVDSDIPGDYRVDKDFLYYESDSGFEKNDNDSDGDSMVALDDQQNEAPPLIYAEVFDDVAAEHELRDVVETPMPLPRVPPRCPHPTPPPV